MGIGGLPTAIPPVVQNRVVGSPSPQAKAIANLTKILNGVSNYNQTFDICHLPRDVNGLVRIPFFAGRNISKAGEKGYVFNGTNSYPPAPKYVHHPLPDTVVYEAIYPMLREINRRLELADIPFRIDPITTGSVENILNGPDWPKPQKVVEPDRIRQRFIEAVECESDDQWTFLGFSHTAYANENYFTRLCLASHYNVPGYPDNMPVRQLTLAHEMGHALGLRHIFDSNLYLDWTQAHGNWGCAMSVMNYDTYFCTNHTTWPADPEDSPEMPDQRLSALLTLLYRPIGIAMGLIIASMNRTAPQSIVEGAADLWVFEDPRIQSNEFPKSLGSADLYLLRRMYNFSCNASNIESNTVSAIEDPESQVVENLVATLGWMMLAAGAQKFIDQGLAQWPVRQWVATIISTMAVVAMMNREVPTVPALALSTTLFGNTLSKLALSTALGVETIVRLNETSDVGSEISHYLVAVVGLISGALVAGNIGSLLAYMTMSAPDYTDFRNHQRTGFEPLVTSETTPLSPLGEHVQAIRNADRTLAQGIQSAYTGGDTLLVRVGEDLVGCIRQPSANQPTEEGDQLVEDGAHDIEMVGVV